MAHIEIIESTGVKLMNKYYVNEQKIRDAYNAFISSLTSVNGCLSNVWGITSFCHNMYGWDFLEAQKLAKIYAQENNLPKWPVLA